MLRNLYKTLTKNDTQSAESFDKGFNELIQNIGRQVKYVFIQDANDYRQAHFFLELIDKKFRPILIPKNWKKSTIEEYLTKFDYSYVLIENNKMLIQRTTDKEDTLPSEIYGVFSSGSSLFPELYFLDVNQARKNARAHGRSLSIDSKFIIYKTLNCDHAFGVCAYIWTAIELRCQVYFLEHFSSWTDFLDCPQKSIVHFTPRQVKSLLPLLKEDQNYPSTITIGSDWISHDVLAQIKKITRSRLFLTYGLTEAGPRVCTFEYLGEPFDNYYPLGSPLDDIECKILDENGKTLVSGQGSLMIKTPFMAINQKSTMDGYLLTRDIVEIKGRDIFLDLNKRKRFKFNDMLIDLEAIKNEHFPEADSVSAIVCEVGKMSFWCLLVESTNGEFVEKEYFEDNEKLKPLAVKFIKSNLLGPLHKLSSETLRKIFDLQTNVTFTFFTIN